MEYVNGLVQCGIAVDTLSIQLYPIDVTFMSIMTWIIICFVLVHQNIPDVNHSLINLHSC